MIWDFAGDVKEWVKDTTSTNFGGNQYMSLVTATSHPNTGTVGALSGKAKFLFGTSGDYTGLSTSPFGGLGLGSISYSNGGICRGGDWGGGVDTGIFETSLYVTTGSYNGLGFRCVQHP